MEPDAPEPEVGEPDDDLCARYAGTTLWLRLAETLAQIACLAALTITGASRALLAAVGGTGSPALRAVAYLSLLAAITRLAALPWSWLSEFVVESRFGLGCQSLLSWFWEWLCRSALIGVGCVLLLLPLSLTLQWWPVAIVPWFGLLIGVRALYYQQVYPVLLRRFYPTRLLRSESFHFPQLGRLCLPVYQVQVSHKTRRVGAHLHLAGRRSAIYVTDTLIYEFTDCEEKVVLAHEFGHAYDRLFLEERTAPGIEQAQRKLLWALLQGCSLVAAFYLQRAVAPHLGLDGVADLAGLPLLVALMLVLGSLVSPFLMAEARRDERDADEYALRITHDAASYRSVMRKLRHLNLEDAYSVRLAHFLFDTHPSYRERLRAAQDWAPRRPRRRRRVSAGR
jgi:STE24 endopeptidase